MSETGEVTCLVIAGPTDSSVDGSPLPGEIGSEETRQVTHTTALLMVDSIVPS